MRELAHALPAFLGRDRVSVAAPAAVLDSLPSDFARLVTVPDTSTIYGLSMMVREGAAQRALPGADVILVPGGIALGGTVPIIAISQTLLPFAQRELRRYPLHRRVRYILLRRLQIQTFNRASGLVFLSETARDTVMPFLEESARQVALIPHGIGDRFQSHSPRRFAAPTASRPFRLLYVSTIAPYKHHDNVIAAVAQLRELGRHVVLTLVGTVEPSSRRMLARAISKSDPQHRFIHHLGAVSYGDVHQHYHDADAFVFASTCENLPIILLEAMASGLPIAASCTPPMPEVLANAAVYFNAESVGSIARAVAELYDDPCLRRRNSVDVVAMASRYTWRSCAEATVEFARQVLGRP